VVVQTRQAALDEVFEQIDLSVDGAFPITPGTTTLSEMTQSPLPCTSNYRWNIPVAGGLQLDGRITIAKPTFHLEVQKGKWLTVRHLLLTTSEQVTIDANITAAAGVESAAVNLDLVKCKSPVPITIWIGPVPVPITPEVKLTTGVSLSQVSGVDPAYTAEAKVTGTFTAGVDYRNVKPTWIHKVNLVAELVHAPPPEAGGALKFTAGFAVGLLVAGWVGPEIGINAYARWNAA
jgi:hypothetical protein